MSRRQHCLIDVGDAGRTGDGHRFGEQIATDFGISETCLQNWLRQPMSKTAIGRT